MIFFIELKKDEYIMHCVICFNEQKLNKLFDQIPLTSNCIIEVTVLSWDYDRKMYRVIGHHHVADTHIGAYIKVKKSYCI